MARDGELSWMYQEGKEVLGVCFAISVDFVIFLEVSVISGTISIIWLTKHVCLHWGELTGSLDSVVCVS